MTSKKLASALTSDFAIFFILVPNIPHTNSKVKQTMNGAENMKTNKKNCKAFKFVKIGFFWLMSFA